MASEEFLLQAIGELKEANRSIADSMGHIKDNLKTLNDHNILHAEKTQQEHNTIIEKLTMLTGKYWWLILILLGIILLVMGYKEAIKFVVPGV